MMILSPGMGVKQLRFAAKKSTVDSQLVETKTGKNTDGKPVKSTDIKATQAGAFLSVKVPMIDKPLYEWIGANKDNTRFRKEVPKGLGISHVGYGEEGNKSKADVKYDKYYLVDAKVSEPFIVNSAEKLSPANFARMQKLAKKLGIFELPMQDPRRQAKNVGEYRTPWLRGQYTRKELDKILSKPIQPGDPNVITYVPSVGSAYNTTYSCWWLRGAEAHAYSLTNSQNPDPKIRERDKKLGARITHTNLSFYVSRPHNIFIARVFPGAHGYHDSGPITAEGAVRVLIDDKARDNMRAGDWTTNTLHIKDRIQGERLDEPWAQLQFDALGMHLAALSKQLQSREHFGWDTLLDHEKD